MTIDSRTAQQNNEMRERSGHVLDKRVLVSVLYELLRDHILPGDLEKVVSDSLVQNDGVLYTNGWLAKYAQDIADRIYAKDATTQTRSIFEAI